MTLAGQPISYTPGDLLRLDDGKLYELVDGVLVEKRMAARQTWVATELSHLLRSAAGRNGWVFVETTVQAFGADRATVRRPDVCFVRANRLPNDRPPIGHILLAPDLCVEVISPTDLAYDVDQQVQQYLDAGVSAVWIVNPELRTLRVHRADGSLFGLHEDDAVTGDQFLPSFRCKVGDFLPPAD
jgi:Uma2 family endonuclease